MVAAISKCTKLLPQRAWNQLFAGAQKGSKRALNRLFDVAKPHITQMANNAGRNAMEIDDFFARGCEALVEAVNRPQANPMKKAQNYLLTCIKGQMLNLRNEMTKHAQRFTSLDAAGYIKESFDPNKLVTIAKSIIDKKSPNPRKVAYLIDILEHAATLPAKKRKIFWEILVNNSLINKTAKEMGMNENALTQAAKRLRAAISEWADKQSQMRFYFNQPK